MHFKPFTIIKKVNGSSSCAIFTLNEIKSNYFPNANSKNCGCICMNGDGVATSAHFEGVTWYNTDLYVVFSSQVNTQIRCTGFLYYYDGEI